MKTEIVLTVLFLLVVAAVVLLVVTIRTSGDKKEEKDKRVQGNRHFMAVVLIFVIIEFISIIVEIKTDGALTDILNRTYRDRHPEDVFYDMTAEEAYWKGNDEGWTSGYEAGMEDGYHKGYEQGYSDGREGY